MGVDIEKLAWRLDNNPYSPSGLGYRAVRHHLRRSRSNAAADSEWAAIESRRETGGPTKVLLSDTLSLADYRRQRDIAAELTPSPFWLPLARKATTWQLGRLVGLGRTVAQRARRGWADSDAGAMSSFLCQQTADMLEHMAVNSRSWPSGDEFPTQHDWATALTSQAEKLRTYVNDPELVRLTERWYAAAADPDLARTPQESALKQQMRDREEHTYGQAQEALRWVADHLSQL